MRLNEVHATELDAWIAERHYLGNVPAGAVLRLEFLDEAGQRIGAMLWGRSTSPKLDQRKLLQLTRIVFEGEIHCRCSRALSMARKYIRKNLPDIKGLITYASSAQEHKGMVYLADGWFPIGQTVVNGKGWENRAGRENRDMGVKLRFARSP